MAQSFTEVARGPVGHLQAFIESGKKVVPPGTVVERDEKHKLEFRMLAHKDVPAVTKTMAVSFVKGEPLCGQLGLTVEDMETFCAGYVLRMVDEGLTVVASNAETGEVLGAMLTEDFCNPDLPGLGDVIGTMKGLYVVFLHKLLKIGFDVVHFKFVNTHWRSFRRVVPVPVGSEEVVSTECCIVFLPLVTCIDLSCHSLHSLEFCISLFARQLRSNRLHHRLPRTNVDDSKIHSHSSQRSPQGCVVPFVDARSAAHCPWHGPWQAPHRAFTGLRKVDGVPIRICGMHRKDQHPCADVTVPTTRVDREVGLCRLRQVARG